MRLACGDVRVAQYARVVQFCDTAVHCSCTVGRNKKEEETFLFANMQHGYIEICTSDGMFSLLKLSLNPALQHFVPRACTSYGEDSDSSSESEEEVEEKKADVTEPEQAPVPAETETVAITTTARTGGATWPLVKPLPPRSARVPV